MLRIKRVENNGFIYYEAVFENDNLYAFSLSDLICQLWQIYGFKLSFFQFNPN